jgi:uroporphyrinogen-III decarboxylase
MFIDIDIKKDEVARREELLKNWEQFKNKRPPVAVFMDAPFYCKLAGTPIEKIYDDPEAMVNAQLTAWKILLENLECDNTGPMVAIDFGSCFTGSLYGCQIVPQPGSVPATHTWFRSENDLAKLEKIDPSQQGLAFKERQYYETLKNVAGNYELTIGGENASMPLDNISLMNGSEGPFSILCMIAGLERVSIWLFEKPDLINKMMELITQKEIQRIKQNFEFMNIPLQPIFIADDYSPYMSEDIYLKFILPYEKKLTCAFPQKPLFHSCIPDKRMLKYWKNDLDICLFNGFKPQNGLENLIRDYSPVVEQMAGTVLLEPDLDGANILIADEKQLEIAANDFVKTFPGPAGVKLCYTFSGGHDTNDMLKCNVFKKQMIKRYPE